MFALLLPVQSWDGIVVQLATESMYSQVELTVISLIFSLLPGVSHEYSMILPKAVCVLSDRVSSGIVGGVEQFEA